MRSASITSSALVLGLTLLACSGSSSSTTSSSSGSSAGKLGGSAKAKTCKNTTINPPSKTVDDACDACDADKCAAEGAALIGSDPNAFGGACGDFITCSCDCDKADTACLTKCPLAQACKDAIDAAQSCQGSKCKTECAKDGG